MKTREAIVEALKTVYDPELPVDVYELGLIYDINIDEQDRKATLTITLTTPSCPAAELIPAEIKRAVLEVAEIDTVEVILTFDPPYTIDRMSEEAKLALGW